MLKNNYLFQKNSVLSTGFQWLKPNCHFSKLQILKVRVPILFLGSVDFSMSVISTKLYFVEIGWVHQNYKIFKCTMLKNLNSDFLHWEDTLRPKFEENFAILHWWCLFSLGQRFAVLQFRIVNECSEVALSLKKIFLTVVISQFRMDFA